MPPAPLAHGDVRRPIVAARNQVTFSSFFLFASIRWRESLRKDRDCSAKRQTPKTDAKGRTPGRGEEKRRKWERKIVAHLLLADGTADWVAERHVRKRSSERPQSEATTPRAKCGWRGVEREKPCTSCTALHPLSVDGEPGKSHRSHFCSKFLH